MATEYIDPDGRRHWADEDSNFAKSGLESGHLRRAGEPVPEKVDETGGGQGDTEKVDETGGEAEDAAVEQDGVGENADGDASGSGDTQRAPRGSRKR